MAREQAEGRRQAWCHGLRKGRKRVRAFDYNAFDPEIKKPKSEINGLSILRKEALFKLKTMLSYLRAVHLARVYIWWVYPVNDGDRNDGFLIVRFTFICREPHRLFAAKTSHQVNAVFSEIE
jgi:hypothetical protein